MKFNGNVKVLYDMELTVANAVQDCFGSAYRVLSAKHEIGVVLQFPLSHPKDPGRGSEEPGRSMVNYKILGYVHSNTVRALLRRNGLKTPLARGHWHIVHSD